MRQPLSHAEIIILDCLNGMLRKAGLRQIVNDNRSALDSAFKVFYASARKFRGSYLCFLPDHHL